MVETSINPYRDCCKNVFKNILDDTSEDSYEAHPQKEQMGHACLNALKEDESKVTSLYHNQLFKLNVNLSKENDKLEKSIMDLKDFVEFS